MDMAFGEPLSAIEKISTARAKLIYSQPFFGSLVMKLKIVEDQFCPTMWTNGKLIGYSPSYVDTISMDELIGVLVHEVLHVAYFHHLRKKDRDHKKWNVACDYAINDLIIESGFQLPEGGWRGKGTDKTAEAIYAELPDPPPSPSAGLSSSGDPSGCGEVRQLTGENGKPLSKAEEAEAINVARQNVAQAATVAKMQGKLPAGMERLITEIIDPVIPWRDVLHTFFARVARNDYNFLKPNRRYTSRGIVLPSLHSPELADGAVIVDTSGSVSDQELSMYAGEISGILEDTGATTHVIYVDSQVAGSQTFTPEDLPLKLEAKGGGGTDFRPGFVHIDDQMLEVSWCVYLTDGYCNSFPDEPSYPVIWGLIGGSRDFTPPFGEVMIIQE
jgi:predicted metal-dependent peptidase